MLLGTLGASLLENLLTGKGIVRVGCGTRGAGSGLKRIFFFLTQPYPLTNFEI